MATELQIKSPCRQCKQSLITSVFYYNGKVHKTCFSCSKIRINKVNICSICGIRAMYNIIGETIGIRCYTHSEPNMINVKCSKCSSNFKYFLQINKETIIANLCIVTLFIYYLFVFILI